MPQFLTSADDLHWLDLQLLLMPLEGAETGAIDDAGSNDRIVRNPHGASMPTFRALHETSTRARHQCR